MKNLNASRPSEHPPVRGRNVKTFRWNHRLQRPNLFMAFKRVIMPHTISNFYLKSLKYTEAVHCKRVTLEACVRNETLTERGRRFTPARSKEVRHKKIEADRASVENSYRSGKCRIPEAIPFRLTAMGPQKYKNETQKFVHFRTFFSVFSLLYVPRYGVGK